MVQERASGSCGPRPPVEGRCQEHITAAVQRSRHLERRRRAPSRSWSSSRRAGSISSCLVASAECNKQAEHPRQVQAGGFPFFCILLCKNLLSTSESVVDKLVDAATRSAAVRGGIERGGAPCNERKTDGYQLESRSAHAQRPCACL
jgi:hypothetical protein